MTLAFFSPGRGGQGRGQGVRFDWFDIPFDSIDIASGGRCGLPWLCGYQVPWQPDEFCARRGQVPPVAKKNGKTS